MVHGSFLGSPTASSGFLCLFLVRHGETDWNLERRYQGQTDTPLNEAGWQQAERLARRLAGCPFDVIYTVTLKRARQTAEAIAVRLGVPVRPDPRLREMRFGLLEGLTFDEAQARYPEMAAAWLTDREQPFPGGETFSQFSARVQGFLDEIRQAHDGQTVLLVSHGGPIKEMLRLALGMPPSSRWAFQIDNASVSKLKLYHDAPILVLLNDTHHLDGTCPG